jgi:hypothetical protein
MMHDRLDELLEEFVANDYAPDGADIEDGGGEHAGHGHEHVHGHGAEGSVREFDYRGHTVRIVTRYEVTIDGEEWVRPMQVLLDGSVVTHDLPQYRVPSAVDLIEAVIDQTYEAPEDVRAAVVDEAEQGS